MWQILVQGVSRGVWFVYYAYCFTEHTHGGGVTEHSAVRVAHGVEVPEPAHLRARPPRQRARVRIRGGSSDMAWKLHTHGPGQDNIGIRLYDYNDIVMTMPLYTKVLILIHECHNNITSTHSLLRVQAILFFK